MSQHEINAFQNKLNVVGIKTYFDDRDPTVDDDGFRIPTLWVNNSTDEAFILVSNDEGAAVWLPLGASLSSYIQFVTDTRPPNTSDNTYPVPTIWVDSTLKQTWILDGITGGVAKWILLGSNQLGDAQDSVLSQVDGNDAPPTEVLGDRYIILDGGGGVVNATWDGASFNDIVEFDGATWVSRTPTEGSFTEVEDEDTVYIFITSWEKLFEYTGTSFASTAEAIAGVITDKVISPSTLKDVFSSPPPIGDVLPNTIAGTQMLFSSVTAPVYQEGLMFYDNATKAFTLYNEESDISLQVGEEQWVRVKNESGATITNGQIVYLNGSSGGMPLIELAQADTSEESHVIGVVTHSILNGTTGYVTTFGLVRGLNTSGFSGGEIIYLSPSVAGGATTTKPTGSDYRTRIGYIGAVDATDGTFFVRIENGGDITDIAGLDEQDIIYVGKHGSDTNAGLNVAQAKLTFTSALAAASSGDAIVCLDGGTYTENLTAVSGVDLHAPNAKLDGTIIGADDCTWTLREQIVGAGEIGVLKSTGSTYFKITFDTVTCTGTGIAAASLSTFINYTCKVLFIENGFGVGNTTSNHIHLTIGDIYITGTGVGIANTAGALVVGSIQHILNTGVGAGTAILGAGGDINLNINYISTTVGIDINSGEANIWVNEVIGSTSAYDISGGVLNLFVGKLTGSIVDTGGTATLTGTLNAGSGIDVSYTAGTGSIITSIGGGYEWIDVTGTSDTIEASNGYSANNTSLVTLTLPSSASLGDTFKVVATNSGLVKIAQNASDQIRFGTLTTTSGVTGYIEAQSQGASIEILCVAANSYIVISRDGTWDIN